MTDDFAEFPFILWEIKDIAVPQTKISPTISFLEMEWKLKFNNTYKESVGGKIDLVLVRLKSRFPINERAFQIQTGIQDTYGNRFMLQNTKSQMKNKYCCVWTDNIANIQKIIYGKYKNVTFFIQVDSMSLPVSCGTDSKNVASIRTPACAMSLFEDFRKLVNNGELADVVLKCGGKQFPAHRAILAARSPFFAAMFRSDMKEARENFVEIRGVEPDVLENVLCYMYTGNIADFSMDSVRQIYLAADMYGIEALTVKCFSLMTDNYAMEPKNDSLKAVNEQSDVEKADDKEERELLRELFQSTEWQALALRNPKLARDMYKPLIK